MPRSLIIGEPSNIFEWRSSLHSEQAETESSMEELNDEDKRRRISGSWSPQSPSWSRRDSMFALTELSTFRVPFSYPGTMKYQDMRKILAHMTNQQRISLFQRPQFMRKVHKAQIQYKPAKKSQHFVLVNLLFIQNMYFSSVLHKIVYQMRY